MINWHIQKFSARAFGACIVFFNKLHSKFAFNHKDLLFETYTGHVQNDYSDISYEYVNILIFVCLIGQGKMQISQGKVREKSGNFVSCVRGGSMSERTQVKTYPRQNVLSRVKTYPIQSHNVPWFDYSI